MWKIVKNLPAMQETHVWSLGQEDSLEKERGAWRALVPGVAELDMTEQLTLSVSIETVVEMKQDNVLDTLYVLSNVL